MNTLKVIKTRGEDEVIGYTVTENGNTGEFMGAVLDWTLTAGDLTVTPIYRAVD